MFIFLLDSLAESDEGTVRDDKMCIYSFNITYVSMWSFRFLLVLLSQDLAATRKRFLEAEYRQIREMIDRDEKEAMLAIDKEQEKGQSKLVSLIKKFNENIETMSRTKSEINILLDQSQSLAFLKVMQRLCDQMLKYIFHF